MFSRSDGRSIAFDVFGGAAVNARGGLRVASPPVQYVVAHCLSERLDPDQSLLVGISWPCQQLHDRDASSVQAMT